MRQAQTFDHVRGFSLGCEGNTERRVLMRGISAFATEGVDFDREIAVHYNPNGSAFDVCLLVHW